ncbi:hypothetical protein [Streptomyces boncukensis]|uniref:Uncharacterized protein n=1 Tax=Streptomyces boncukensis TaxID=2711219 RepID=A0A6G4WY20_9ACTN|nr:hypothetical protein [Streptomyces boncukensis]NGO69530.1 hypothetical protein [Streptomyces boncukensis]
MARWGLIVEELPVGGNALPLANVLAEFEAVSRREAEELAKPHIRAYTPRHPMTPKRNRLYRTADGWMLVGEGAFQKHYPYHFRVCELEWDSDAAPVEDADH